MTRISEPAPGNTTRFPPPWIGGLLFLGGFLATSLAFGVVASRPFPLPTADGETLAEFYRNERAALLVAGACHLISLSGLVLFFRSTRAVIGGRWTVLAFWGATVSLAATALLTGWAAESASGLSISAIENLVAVTFYVGGVVHVVALGAFVAGILTAANPLRTAKGFCVVGFIAAGAAGASIVSVVVEPAAVLLPIGRVLCMLWILALGVAWTRLLSRDAVINRPTAVEN